MAQLFGYVRVSTIDQNMDRQLDALKEYGVDESLIYQEKITGTKKDRPELIRMLNEIQKGDTLVICDMTRISRSTRDMLDIIEKIRGKGAYIKSLKDTWLDTTSSNPHSQFLLIIISALAQLERDLISQRTKEGLKAAKARGRKGGRPSIQNKYRDSVIAMYWGGMKISEIVTETKISRSTVKRIIKSNKEESR